MIENVYPINRSMDDVAVHSRKLPRNVRACGQGGGPFPVYIEDYADTYIRRLTDSGFPECSAVVLVGQVMETEIGRCLFVRGGINANKICAGDKPVFGEDVWNEVYEKIRLYFPGDEVVGWCIAGPGFRLLQEEPFLRAHIDNFADSEKVFLCYESLEKELTIRICRDGRFRVLPGHYIYYEKNDEMQNYLVEEGAFVRNGESMLIRESRASEVKEQIHEEAEPDKSGSVKKDILQLAAIACIIVFIVSVMMGTDSLSLIKESVLAGKKTGENEIAQAGETMIADAGEEKKDVVEEPDDGEEFAFGDFDFLDAMSNGVQEDSPAEVEGEGGQQDEDEQPGKDGQQGRQQDEDEQPGKDAQQGGQQDEDEQPGKDGQQEEQQGKGDAYAGESGGVGQETQKEGVTEQDEQQIPEKEEFAQEEELPEEPDADTIETETVTVLAPTEYKSYIVKKGDTLAQICKEFYGSVELLHFLCELNQLKDVDSIYIGQELILPKK